MSRQKFGMPEQLPVSVPVASDDRDEQVGLRRKRVRGSA
jgi:hypothetical protein